MSTETLYPERQRCKTCRKAFKDTVLAGLYCSYKCGKFPEPAKNIIDAPRGCKRELNGKWDYKVKYLNPDMVPDKFKKDPTTNIYLCDNCRTWHIGHSRPEEYETLTRYVNSYKELGSVIQRHRETLKIDKKVLAKQLKVPIIRITELENGNPNVNIGLLFKVLEALRLRVSIMNLKNKK